jgi:hypothetical protein
MLFRPLNYFQTCQWIVTILLWLLNPIDYCVVIAIKLVLILLFDMRKIIRLVLILYIHSRTRTYFLLFFKRLILDLNNQSFINEQCTLNYLLHNPSFLDFVNFVNPMAVTSHVTPLSSYHSLNLKWKGIGRTQTIDQMIVNVLINQFNHKRNLFIYLLVLRQTFQMTFWIRLPISKGFVHNLHFVSDLWLRLPKNNVVKHQLQVLEALLLFLESLWV